MFVSFFRLTITVTPGREKGETGHARGTLTKEFIVSELCKSVATSFPAGKRPEFAVRRAFPLAGDHEIGQHTTDTVCLKL